MIQLHHCDLLDSASLPEVLEAVKPDEIYYLTAQSHVKVSFEMPEYTAEATRNGSAQAARSDSSA